MAKKRDPNKELAEVAELEAVSDVAFYPRDAEYRDSIKTTVEWQDHVLGHLDESEFWEGIPRMDGLRRLVEKLIGRILSTKTEIMVEPGTGTNWVICIATICIRDYISGEVMSYQATSDANYMSVAPAFRNRLSSIAENRAKSKAYREILRLGNVASTEEVNSNPDLDEQDYILSSQVSMISVKVDKLGVDLPKLLESRYSVTSLDQLKHSQAGDLIKLLSAWASKREQVDENFLKKG